MASIFIHLAPHESEIELEVTLRNSYELLEPKLRPPFSLSIPTQEEYHNLNKAILFGLLCEPHFAKVHIKHLHGIVTDGYSCVTSMLTKVVNELYVKLIGSVKVQLLWVVREMVDVSSVGIDGLLVSLLRQIVGGDCSQGNLWLCLEMVSLFMDKWDSLLEAEPLVLTRALYVFLRLLSDHYRIRIDPKIELLKRKEIEFCTRVLREQFHLCLKIGRDLVRILQDLVHIPEFRAVWKDLVLNPSELKTEGFVDISQLYHARTSSMYFLLRITPEMELHLRFLLTHVKLGSQKRHQMWFARKYLSVPERETLIIDIVRFICCGHHPPNEIIQSDIIPRWAVIGWLLTICRNKYIEANVKLALFYDWLFFDDKVDNIMNIEPAILLMVNSIPKYIDITHVLLDFLFYLLENYDLERKHIISKGVATAVGSLVKRGVFKSVDVFTCCEMLNPSLREKVERLVRTKDT